MPKQAFNVGTGAVQQFKTGQHVRYLGNDTGGSYQHGDILRIDSLRMGEFYNCTIIASSIPARVGNTSVLPPHVAQAMPAGRPMSPGAFRKLKAPRLESEPRR
jgi:hypothetical protein